jgi:hypothetical protein
MPGMMHGAFGKASSKVLDAVYESRRALCDAGVGERGVAAPLLNHRFPQREKIWNTGRFSIAESQSGRALPD